MVREDTSGGTFGQLAEELVAATRSLLDDLVQEGALRMLMAALGVEVEAYIAEHGTAKDHLHAIMYAPDRVTADKEMKRFDEVYSAKHPRAVASLLDHKDPLLTFLDFPAEHWVHLRTTNPIELTFSTVKARTKKTHGACSRAAALAMTFKLIETAEQRWQKVNAPHLVAAVLSGLSFKDGLLVKPAEPALTTDTNDVVRQEVAA